MMKSNKIENFGDWGIEKRVSYIVNALLDPATDPEVAVRMAEWFKSNMSENEKYQVLKRVVDKLQPDTLPNQRVIENYNILAEELGLTKINDVAKSDKMSVKQKMTFGRLSLGIAAVLIPFLVIVGYICFYQSEKEVISGPLLVESVVKTDAGVQKNVILKDSTIVWVNSSSELSSVSDTDKAREVHLSGEAFFEVTPDNHKPFIVHTDNIHVKVLGTKFNLTAYPTTHISEIILYEGEVEVYADNMSEKLKPGQKLIYYNDVKKYIIETVAEFNDWRTDDMYVANRTLEDLFRMIGNYYEINIVYDSGAFSDAGVYSVSFGKQQTAAEVIRSLSIISGQFDYTINDDDIKIFRLDK